MATHTASKNESKPANKPSTNGTTSAAPSTVKPVNAKPEGPGRKEGSYASPQLIARWVHEGKPLAGQKDAEGRPYLFGAGALHDARELLVMFGKKPTDEMDALIANVGARASTSSIPKPGDTFTKNAIVAGRGKRVMLGAINVEGFGVKANQPLKVVCTQESITIHFKA